MSLSRVVLGMHSFRCSEALFGGLHGVQFTRIGYTGGITPNPRFKAIGDHVEVVEVNYDPKIISLPQILEVFFQNHDYSAYTASRYQSSIFFTDIRQKYESEYFIQSALPNRAVTMVRPLKYLHDAEHTFHKFYLQNTPTIMLQLLYEYKWDWRTWFPEFNILPFVTKLNSALSGLYPMDYVEKILDSINVPDCIKSECRLRASHQRPQCIFL